MESFTEPLLSQCTPSSASPSMGARFAATVENHIACVGCSVSFESKTPARGAGVS